MWMLPTVNPFGFSPNYDTLYNRGDDDVRNPLDMDSVPPIDFAFPTWDLARAEASSTSTAGTPSLVSSSDPDYLSPPTVMSASPVFHAYDMGFSSIPVSPPPPPCHVPSIVRNLSFIQPSLILTVATISNHLRNQGMSSHSMST